MQTLIYISLFVKNYINVNLAYKLAKVALMNTWGNWLLAKMGQFTQPQTLMNLFLGIQSENIPVILNIMNKFTSPSM